MKVQAKVPAKRQRCRVLKPFRLCTRDRRICLMGIGFLGVVFLLLLFTAQIISIIFTVLLLVLGSMSSIFRRMTGDIDIGIGFIPFSTIMIFLMHGFAPGLISCAIMLVTSAVIVGQVKPYILWSFGLFSIVGAISLLLPFSIPLAGIILVVIYNALFFAVDILLGSDAVENVVYTIGSTIFNYVLFYYFAPIMILVL